MWKKELEKTLNFSVIIKIDVFRTCIHELIFISLGAQDWKPLNPVELLMIVLYYDLM